MGDRHKQIAKWLKENAANIDHQYNISNLAKCNYHSHQVIIIMHLTYLIHFLFKKTALEKKTDKVTKEKSES